MSIGWVGLAVNGRGGRPFTVSRPVQTHFLTGATAGAFSPDGRRLATNGSGREPVRIWDLESRQQVCTLPIEPSYGSILQFSADGRSLAFGTTSRQMRIISVELPR